MQMPEIGQIFHRKYELRQRLGTSGASTVFRAADVQADREVALKIIVPAEDGYSEGTESRFQREVKIVARLRDPHNITMYDFGRSDDGLLYLVFEYVPGHDLAEAIETRGPMPQDEVVHIVRQVLHALREAHNLQLLHRDIKPSNIRLYDYMGDANRVKLLDFGIAKPVEATGDMQITRAGALIGTPRYMSPEQIVSGGLSPASDLYSLGLVAYEMLAGRPAIEGEHRSDFIRQQMSDDPIVLPAHARAGSVLRNVVERMVARDAAARFQSADEVLEALTFIDEPADTLDDPPDARRDTILEPSPAGTSADVDTFDEVSDGLVEPSEPSKTRVEIPAAILDSTTQKDVVADLPDMAKVRSSRHRKPTPAGFREVDAASRRRGSGLTMSNLLVIPLGLAIGAGVVLGLSALFGGDDDERFPPHADAPPSSYQHVAEEPSAGLPEDAPHDEAPSVAAAEVALNASIDAGSPAAIADGGADGGDDDAGLASEQLALSDKGCGVEPPFEGERELAMKFAGQRRTWITYLPKGYDEGTEHPVVMLFHNAGQSGRMILRDTALRELANEHGFVVLAPNSNKGDLQQMIFPFSGKDEGFFLEKALVETSKLVCLDSSRVYAVGHSLGGRIAERLPCYMPLSGIATTGFRPLADERGCTPKAPVPYLHIIADQDRYLAVGDGPNCLGHHKVSQQSHIDTWKYHNNCSGEAAPYDVPEAGTCQIWNECEASFASCVVRGGRDWPTAAPIELEQRFDLLNCHEPPADFPYGEVIWQFFAKHGTHQ